MAGIAAVLLNYNDGETTVQACERIRGFKNIDRIILVDNASTDGSREKLASYVQNVRTADAPEERVFLIKNDKNGGYGYGNNRGADAAKALGCDYVLIANPDVIFTEKTVETLKEAMETENASVSGGLMEGTRYTDCAWPLLSLMGELAYSGPFLKRLLRREISYPRAFFRMLPAPVGAVHGSLLMVNTDDFFEVGGFDEQVFLFMEEKILGKRMAMSGKHIVLTDATYRHAGSASMKKAGLNSVNRQKERQKAERYYYKNYLGAGFFAMLLVRLQQMIVLLETGLAAKAGKI